MNSALAVPDATLAVRHREPDGVVSAPNAKPRSRADGKRSSGRFAKQWLTTRSSGAGMLKHGSRRCGKLCSHRTPLASPT